MTSEEIPHIVRGKTPRLQAKRSLCYWQRRTKHWNKAYLYQRFCFLNTYLYQENFFKEKLWCHLIRSIFRLYDKFKRNLPWEFNINDLGVRTLSRARIYLKQPNFDCCTNFSIFSANLFHYLHQVYRGYQSNWSPAAPSRRLLISRTHLESFRRVQVVPPARNNQGSVSLKVVHTNKSVPRQPPPKRKTPYQTLLSAFSHQPRPPAIPILSSTIFRHTQVDCNPKVKIVPFILL